MEFPSWVDEPKKPRDRARSRLKFILTMLAINATGRTSYRAFAAYLGLDHSTLSNHVRNGACSPRTAMIIESKCGTSLVSANDLCNPLEIKVEIAA